MPSSVAVIGGPAAGNAHARVFTELRYTHVTGHAGRMVLRSEDEVVAAVQIPIAVSLKGEHVYSRGA
jgi:hypothetical protein